MRTDIAVVVCAHDEARWNELRAALASLDRQTVSPAEVIVVVDHNSELFERVKRELDVGAVENSEPRGLGGARNTGVGEASASVVAFLDDDAMASSHWLALLAERYRDPDVAGVGGSAEPLWISGRPVWFPREFDWVVGCSYLGMPKQPSEVRNLFGCNMSFRRELLVALGGFRLGYGCDETEFCIRLGQRWPDKRIMYVPKASVVHHVPASRARFRRFITRCYFEGGSKAVVARLVGSERALSTEVRYTREVLPRALRRDVSEFTQHGDLDGLRRAGTVVAGLLSTAAGYATGGVATSRAARRRGWSGGDLRVHS